MNTASTFSTRTWKRLAWPSRRWSTFCAADSTLAKSRRFCGRTPSCAKLARRAAIAKTRTRRPRCVEGLVCTWQRWGKELVVVVMRVRNIFLFLLCFWSVSLLKPLYRVVFVVNPSHVWSVLLSVIKYLFCGIIFVVLRYEVISSFGRFPSVFKIFGFKEWSLLVWLLFSIILFT